MSKKPKREEQEREESNITSTISVLLTVQLVEHKEALLAEIKDTYAKYEAILDTVQATVNDHQLRINKLEQFANSVGDKDPRLTVLASENAKLKAKITDLEGRSRHKNIHDMLGTDVLVSPPELDRAHRTRVLSIG